MSFFSPGLRSNCSAQQDLPAIPSRPGHPSRIGHESRYSCFLGVDAGTFLTFPAQTPAPRKIPGSANRLPVEIAKFDRIPRYRRPPSRLI